MGGSVAIKPDLATPTGIPGVVGNGPLPTSADAIGDPWIEGHGRCAAGGPGCFLSPEVRRELVHGYQLRVGEAQKAFDDALMQISVETLIKKDDDLPLWIGLMFDVIGGLAVGGIAGGFKLALQSTGEELGTLQGMTALQTTPYDPARPSFRTLIHSVDPASVASIAKIGVDLAKPAAKASPPHHEKAVRLDYINELKIRSASAWQAQAEKPPSYASDGQLIVLYHAFKAENGHDPVAYQAALEDKIRRFMASPVSRIGRVHTTVDKDIDVADRGTEGFVLRDTKVVWVQHHDHLPPTLYYEKRDAADHNNDYTRDHLDVIPLGAEASFHLTTPVEPEFIESALARHKETWGSDPEVYDIDSVPAPWAGARASPPSAPAPAPLPANNKVAPPGLGFPPLPLGPA